MATRNAEQWCQRWRRSLNSVKLTERGRCCFNDESHLNLFLLKYLAWLKPFVLIPGWTTDQGCGISEGKFQDKYQKEIRAL